MAVSLATAAALVFASDRLANTAAVECLDYANTTWQGEPFQTRVERDFSTPLLVTRPGRLLQSFSTECGGTLVVVRPGMFRALVLTRNPTEFYVNEQRVLETHEPRLQHATGTFHLATGLHHLRFRYSFSGGADEPALFMSRVGHAPRPLDATYVSRQPLSATAYVLRVPARVAWLVIPAFWVVLVIHQLRSPVAGWFRRGSAPFVRWHLRLSRSTRWSLGLIVALAIAVRVALSFGTYGILWPDSEQYLDTARAYLRGDFLSHNLLSTPLFSAFLATFLAWNETPEAGAVMIAAQRALAIAATVVMFRLAREAFDPTIALYATLLWTLSVTQLYYETVVGTEALFVVVLILTMFTAARMLQSASLFTAALVGLMCAVLTLTRPVGKGLVLVVLAVAWWRGPERRRLVLRSALLLSVFAASVAPWTFVNQQTYGFWAINRGEGLWLFLRTFDIDDIEPPATTKFPQVKEAFEALRVTQPYLHYAVRDELNYNRGHSAARADDVMFGFALEAIVAHPVRFAVGTLEQLFFLFAAPYRSVHICESTDGPHLCSQRSIGYAFPAFPNQPVAGRRQLKTAIAAYFRLAYWVVPLLSVFAAIGIVRSLCERHDRTGPRVLLAATVLYLAVATAMFNTVQDRYRLPADAFLIMFAIAALQPYAAQLFAPSVTPLPSHPPNLTSADG
jgi:hypothetical protein